MKHVSPLAIIIILLLVVVGCFALTRCKLSCTTREGLSHRLTTTKLLMPYAYQRGYKTPYSQKWDYDLDHAKEEYTSLYKCNKLCEDVMGATPKANCIQSCKNQAMYGSAMRAMTKKCVSDGDCGPRELCVSPGPYSGGVHGYCMSDNEPGIPRADLPSLYSRGSRENLALPVTCMPGEFFNEAAGECQPIFQGVSSARAIKAEKPGPPPLVTMPGTTTLGYGVGYIDPVNIPLLLGPRGTELQLVTDE